ncbi:DHA1 family inner membrane transport protein [Rhizobium subbaraonis]|uniref:DHA1 family inner membrane transport protein n=1 Tax=Rhizobium subbaraonis TaxID=908946 RepID=A0A285UDJ6_9HYPH|nr:DHA1 family inner membrane transport protein [Rhizobium subbaraonis]
MLSTQEDVPCRRSPVRHAGPAQVIYVTQSHITADTLPASAQHPVSALTVSLIIFALAVGSFGIGTGEFAIMGLLPDVAGTFAVTNAQAGYVISAYAFGVVVGAPVLAVMGARFRRRDLLLAFMGVFAIGNIASALAPTFASFILMRFLTGLPHGAYFGVAALVAASMVPVNKRTQAVGRVMLGLTLATLIGTPLAAFFGQILDWQYMFAAVGVTGALTVVLIAVFLPRDEAPVGINAFTELEAFKRKQVWLTLGIAATGFCGMFAVFTYISPIVTEVAGLDLAMVPIVMAVFGSGMIVGNIFGAKLADLSLMRTIGWSLLVYFLVLVTLSLTAHIPAMLFLCCFLIGCSFVVGPALQTRLMDVAGNAQTLAAALNHSAFNVANALGALLGGLSISHGYGYASMGYVGAIMAVCGFAVFSISVALDRRDRQVGSLAVCPAE